MLFADGDGSSLDFFKKSRDHGPHFRSPARVYIKDEHYFHKGEHGANTAFTLNCFPLANSHSLSVTVFISHT